MGKKFLFYKLSVSHKKTVQLSNFINYLLVPWKNLLVNVQEPLLDLAMMLALDWEHEEDLMENLLEDLNWETGVVALMEMGLCWVEVKGVRQDWMMLQDLIQNSDVVLTETHQIIFHI